MSNIQFFKIDKDTLNAILANFGRNEKSLKDDVVAVREWMKTQKHLPEILNDNHIQNFLFMNKCSIEKTKQKIKIYYTIRSLMPDMFENINPKHPHMRFVSQVGCFLPLPALTKDLEKVWLVKLLNKDLINKIQPKDVMAQFVNLMEIQFQEYVSCRNIAVFDWEGITFEFYLKCTPAVVAKIIGLYEKVYSSPTSAFYIINAPSFINSALAILKRFLKPKLYERIFVCEDTSIVLKILPKQHVPKDYGGDSPSVQELFDELKKKFDEYQDRFDELDTFKVDESLREEKLENDDVLGFYGNFKQLEID